MAGITLETAEAKLSGWLDAEDAVMGGQSYSMGSRQLTRADLAMIGERIKYWDNKVIRLSRGGGIKVTGATPL